MESHQPQNLDDTNNTNDIILTQSKNNNEERESYDKETLIALLSDPNLTNDKIKMP